MGNNTWDNTLDPFPVARGTSQNTFTTAKDVSPGPALPVTYANELKLGSKVELEAWGEYSGATGNTLQLGFGYGITSLGGLLSTGIIIAANALTAIGTSPAAWPWHMRWGGIVTTVGTAGVIYGSGILDLGSSLTAMTAGITIPITAAARSVGSFDTTVQKAWSVVAQWGTSAAGNIIITDAFNVKIANQGKTG